MNWEMTGSEEHSNSGNILTKSNELLFLDYVYVNLVTEKIVRMPNLT